MNNNCDKQQHNFNYFQDTREGKYFSKISTLSHFTALNFSQKVIRVLNQLVLYYFQWLKIMKIRCPLLCVVCWIKLDYYVILIRINHSNVHTFPNLWDKKHLPSCWSPINLLCALPQAITAYRSIVYLHSFNIKCLPDITHFYVIRNCYFLSHRRPYINCYWLLHTRMTEQNFTTKERSIISG